MSDTTSEAVDSPEDTAEEMFSVSLQENRQKARTGTASKSKIDLFTIKNPFLKDDCLLVFLNRVDKNSSVNLLFYHQLADIQSVSAGMHTVKPSVG